MLARGFAVINDQFAVEVAANGQHRCFFIDQESLAVMADAQAFDRQQAAWPKSGVRVGAAALIAGPVNLE